MARPRKPMATLTVDLLVADQATKAGHKYSTAVLESIAAAINKKDITVEELSPVERKAKGKPVCYSWPEHAMAVSTGAAVNDGILQVTFAVKNNKYGKLLMTTVESVGGIGKMSFMPVGIGDVDADNNIQPGYSIQYVTFNGSSDAKG